MCDLSLKVSQLKQKQNQLAGSSTADGIRDFALIKTAVYVGETILSDRAITFPDIYRKFCEFHQSASGELRRYRLLSYLGGEFGHLMSSVCHQTKTGRIFYRTKCDPFLLLSHALAGTVEQKDNPEPSMSVQVRTVTDYLNDKIHCVAESLVKGRKQDPRQANTFDIESFVEGMDSEIWDAVCRLTQTVYERRGQTSELSRLSAHVKKVRRTYLLSVILFCTNNQCCIPLHLVLADVIEACGGSTDLLSILNRVGAVASVDTLKRHL